MLHADRPAEDHRPTPEGTTEAPPLKIRGLPSAATILRRGKAVITFGVFDAMHRGQQALLAQVVRSARTIGAPSAAVVFRPRPTETLGIAEPRPYLTPADETVRLIRRLGVDYAGILRFSRQLAEMQAPEYLQRLMRRLPFRALWLGPKATVGRGPQGTPDSVRDIGRVMGFSLELFTPASPLPSEGDLVAAFDAKDLAAVREALGRPYELPAYVAPADNAPEGDVECCSVVIPERLFVPPDGHYAVTVAPAAFGGEPPDPHARPGWGILEVVTPRSVDSAPRLTLMTAGKRGWADTFVTLGFEEAYRPRPQQLLEWSARRTPAETLPGASEGNGRTGGARARGRRSRPIRSTPP